MFTSRVFVRFAGFAPSSDQLREWSKHTIVFTSRAARIAARTSMLCLVPFAVPALLLFYWPDSLPTPEISREVILGIVRVAARLCGALYFGALGLSFAGSSGVKELWDRGSVAYVAAILLLSVGI